MGKIVRLSRGRPSTYCPGASLPPEVRTEVVEKLREAAGGRGTLAAIGKAHGLRVDLLSRMAKAEGLRFPPGRRTLEQLDQSG